MVCIVNAHLTKWSLRVTEQRYPLAANVEVHPEFTVVHVSRFHKLQIIQNNAYICVLICFSWQYPLNIIFLTDYIT